LFFTPDTQAPIGDGERTTTFTYAANGQCTSVTDDLGRVMTYAYDTVGWLSTVRNPENKTIKATLRDLAGNVTETTQTDISDLGGAPQVFAWSCVYDSLNRCVSVRDNAGNTSTCAYDSLDRVVKTTDARGNDSFYAYDLLGRQTLAVADLDGDSLPDLAQDIYSSFVWSGSSEQLLAMIDSHGNTTSFGYDSLGRCTSATCADGTQHSFTWAPTGDLVREEDPNGTVILHTYDLNGRCVSNDITPGVSVSASTRHERFAYDGCSQLVSASNDGSESSFGYDSLGNCTRGVSGGLGALTTFDSLGNRLTLTYPGGRTLSYVYDSQDRCASILESGASLATFEYDGPDRVARINYANGTRTRISYDGISGTPNAPGDFGHGQVSRVRHGVVGALLLVNDVSLAWDPNGNKTTRKDSIFAPAIPHTNTMTLGYDAANRLTRATVLNGPTTLRDTVYGLDRMGNRTKVSGAANCSGSYFMDGLSPGPLDFQMNQYTTTPCDSRKYDENGNLVGRSAGAGSSLNYTYDYAGRLVSVGDSKSPVAIYAYNALGQRISKTVFDSGGLPPVTTQFIYDGDNVIEERVGGVVRATFVLDGSRSQDDEVIQMQRNGQSYFYHTDDQGNVLALTDAKGDVAERYEYDDYGAVTFLTSDGVPTSATSSVVGNDYGWGGLRLDAETGMLCDDGSEYLEPQTGQSISRRGSSTRNSDGLVFNVVNPRAARGNNPWSGGTSFGRNVPRYLVKADGMVYDRVAGSGGGASPARMQKGTVKFFNETKGFGLTRLLESIQDEAKGFSSLIR
jgi:YD repeat-containing protein